MNYRQTIQYLYDQLPVFHRIGPAAYKPDMGNIEALCEMLGQPHQNFVPFILPEPMEKVRFPICWLLYCKVPAIKPACTPLLTSKTTGERFRINGKMMLKSEVIDFVKNLEKRV
jgi:dihydrofolate synthase / folylpolyglutamate synthase